MNCLICGLTENLQNHHTNYDPPEIIILCRSCHQKQHNGHGVGSATFQKKPIPDDFIKYWKTHKPNEATIKYNVSYATVLRWAKRLELSKDIRSKIFTPCPRCEFRAFKKGKLPTLNGPKRRWVCEKGHNFTTEVEE